jgi:hypothetical protein
MEAALEPAVVADRVFDAIRSQQLYVWTHPEFKDAVRRRTDRIVEGRNPEPPA